MSFADFLATPIIISPDMSESDFAIEFAQMRLRQQAAQEFCDGEIDVVDFLDILDNCGVQVDTAVSDWSKGISYIGG
jgi:hypothetical protein